MADADPYRRRVLPTRIGSPTALARPFFEEKGRAFWMLQAIGWSGYLLVRTVSLLSIDMDFKFVLAPIIETIIGYCITLLLSALYGWYRRLPRISGILLTLATLGAATLIYAVLNAFSFSLLGSKAAEAGINVAVVLQSMFINFTVLAGWSALYFGINFYLIV
ncbi:MAG: sensor histidine kinase, partial [Sphingomonas sp.]